MSGMGTKIKDLLFRNIGYIVILIASAVYIGTAVLKIEETGKTIWQIVADGAVALFLGFFISIVMDIQGIINGDANERVIATLRVHGETVVKVTPFLGKLDEWCRKKNAENLKFQRIRILAGRGLRYEDYFTADGVARDIVPDREKLRDKYRKRAERERIACARRAVDVKLTPLCAGELTSDGGRTDDPYYFGRTKLQYERRISIVDILARLGIAFIVGYYSVRMIENFSYANLLWNCLQVCLFILLGTFKMLQSYLFVVDEWRGRVVKKTNCLETFWSDMCRAKETEEKKNGEI